MEFTPITKEEFPMRYQKGGRHASPFAVAVRALDEIGAGFSTPCLWSHVGNDANRRGCPGTMTAHQVAKRAGIHVRTTCQDGIFYVLRIEIEDGVKKENHDN